MRSFDRVVIDFAISRRSSSLMSFSFHGRANIVQPKNPLSCVLELFLSYGVIVCMYVHTYILSAVSAPALDRGPRHQQALKFGQGPGTTFRTSRPPSYPTDPPLAHLPLSSFSAFLFT